MIGKKIFNEDEIEKQHVYKNEYWNVLFPRKPFSPYHLMIVVNNHNKKTFDDLTEDEVLSLYRIVKKMTRDIKQNYDNFIGYNLFSNNGSEKVGQHMDQFHQHIFIRLSNEEVSPYVSMANKKPWSVLGEKEWSKQKSRLSVIFQK